MKLKNQIRFFGRMAGNYFIPAVFCLLLVVSLLRIRPGSAALPADVPDFPEYIEGFVYRAVWNKGDQLIFVPQKGERILLSVGRLNEELLTNLRTGRYVRMQTPARSVALPKHSTNPGGFDQKEYLASRNVNYISYPKNEQIQLISEAEIALSFKIKTFCRCKAAQARQSLALALEETLGPQNAAVAMAVLTGDTGGIDPENMRNYRDAGIAHVMAVSGMHVGFVQNFILRLLSRKKIGYATRMASCILFLLLFACLADFSPSVTRAVLQNSYILVAKVLKRPYQMKNALLASCAIQLAANPFVLHHSGFLLSYAAAGSILLIKPALTKRIFFFGKIPGCIASGVAVNLGMTPLLITFFNSLSPIGILATVFASKLAYWICMSGFSIWLAYFLPAGTILCKIPASFTAAVLYGLDCVSAVGAGIPAPLGAFRVPGMKIRTIILYYAVLWIVLHKRYTAFIKKHVLPVILGCAVFFTSCWIRADRTEILFFDVGQGFSALIRTREICGLIDGGNGKTDISSLLFRQGIGTLDFILLTHGHSDHAGGISDVLKEHTVKCILVPDNPYDTGAAALCREAASRNVTVIRIRGRGEYLFGDLHVNLYANENHMISAENSDVNNSSLVMSAGNINGSVLFTGDIERETEDHFIENKWIGKTDVLAVAHHGSDSGSEEKNISIISPEYAIISVGRKNRYGHPSGRVTETLENAGVKLYRSDLCGAVRITMRKGKLHPWQKSKISNRSKIT